jgi:hypothetical protein
MPAAKRDMFLWLYPSDFLSRQDAVKTLLTMAPIEKDGASNSWKEALFSKNVPRSSKVRVSQLKKLLSRPISPHSTSLWSSRRLFICSQSNGSNMAPRDGFAVSAAGNELRHAYRICTVVAGLLPTRWRHRYSRRWLGTCKCASFCFEKGMACILLRTLLS